MTTDNGIQETRGLAQCAHIAVRHHAGLREALPRIEALLDAVVGAHGDDHPRLGELQRAFGQFRAELEPHLRSERELLFPACVAPQRQVRPVQEALLVAYERDHVRVRHGLAALRALAADYDPRAAVCSTHRTLLESLAVVEGNLHRQLDEEEAVLFPHARRMGGQPRPEPTRPSAGSRVLSRCCEAWIGEQAHAWAGRRVRRAAAD